MPIPQSQWLPAETVTVLSHEDYNLRAVDGKRFTGYAAWQINGIVAATGSGELLAMSVLIEPPDVVLVRSRDGGRTWSRPKSVWPNRDAARFGIYVATLRVLRSGRIVAVVNAEYPAYPEDHPYEGWSVYSDDGGTAWKQGRKFSRTAPFVSVTTPSQMFEDEAGTLWMPVQGPLRERGRSEMRTWLGESFAVGFLRSKDGGETWGDALVAFQADPKSGIFPAEPAVVPWTRDRWLMLVRQRLSRPHPIRTEYLSRSVSTDHGRTWSPPEHTLADGANHGIHRLPDGGLLYTGMGPTGVRYLVSYDEGRSWAYEHSLEASGDSAYSAVAVDEETMFLVHSSATGGPYYWPNGMPKPGYYYSGMRGWRLRKTPA